MEEKEILQEIIKWLGNDTSYLSTRTDYAKGYKDGIEQAKVIVESIINEHNPDLLANNWYLCDKGTIAGWSSGSLLL